MACIRAQLACASMMLGTNVTYAIIYLVVVCQTSGTSNEIGIVPPVAAPIYPIAAQPIHIPRTQVVAYIPPTVAEPQDLRQRTVQCQNCRTVIEIV